MEITTNNHSYLLNKITLKVMKHPPPLFDTLQARVVTFSPAVVFIVSTDALEGVCGSTDTPFSFRSKSLFAP